MTHNKGKVYYGVGVAILKQCVPITNVPFLFRNNRSGVGSLIIYFPFAFDRHQTYYSTNINITLKSDCGHKSINVLWQLYLMGHFGSSHIKMIDAGVSPDCNQHISSPSRVATSRSRLMVAKS